MGDIAQHIKNWENCLVGKDRSQMTQAQRLERLIEKLRERRFYNHVEVDGWQMAYALYDETDAKGKRHYSWLKKDLKLTDPDDPASYRRSSKPEWQPLALDQSWGDLFVTAFLKTSFTVPKAFNNKPMFFLFFCGGDGILRINGEDFQGADCFHTEMYMKDLAKGGKKLKLEVETFQKHEVDVERFHDLMMSSMALLDTEVEDFYWDAAAAFSAAREDFATDEAREYILHHLDEAFKMVDVFEPDHEAFRNTVLPARTYLKKHVVNSGKFKHEGRIAAVGHSHLDIVYKWEYAEYLRKIGRTHTTQLRLIEEFPEFKFSQSQAITYYEMKRLYPDTYKKIQKAVKAGKWEILGACFSESDHNVVAGESHVRNIMLGKRFFQEEFGVEPKIAWQCDLFGVVWTMPQIYKKSGVDYFVTHKMSIWNTENPWPYNIYHWEGPDGSSVIAHTPSTHIIQTCEGFQLQRHWEDFGEKLPAKESLYTYGWGDGGSGVMRDMIHRAKRYHDFPGVPEVSFELAEDFFQRVDKSVEGRNDLPVWSNELYLETHRGTFTTSGQLKKYNRYAEILMRNAEIVSSLAMMLTGFNYPQQQLNEAWIELLKAHFHDGVTGTHTLKAYGEVCEFYENAIAAGEAVQAKAVKALAVQADTRGAGDALMMFNPLTWSRTDLCRIPYESNVKVLDEQGDECLSQIVERFGSREIWFENHGIPSVGYAVYRKAGGRAARMESGIKATDHSLENDHVRVKLDKQGHVTSLYDKARRRECISKGEKANRFQLIEDISGYYEAWDLYNPKNVRHWDVDAADEVKLVEHGALRAAIEIKKKIHDSYLIQRIVLWKDARWVDFETTIDWKEAHKALKVAFPLDITAFQARYDIPFGNMDRPTHRTTTWEQAKFEVVAHKWADLSDAGFGVSLINDCKYGYDCEKNVMRLTLLRSPKMPNPESDMHEHTFTYRLMPHDGDFRAGGTIRNAWEMNAPVLTQDVPSSTGQWAPARSFMEVKNEHILLEALKKAEDSDDLIVRFVDHWGQKDQVNVKCDFGTQSSTEVDLVERKIGKARKDKGRLKFNAGTFEIKSFQLGSK